MSSYVSVYQSLFQQRRENLVSGNGEIKCKRHEMCKILINGLEFCNWSCNFINFAIRFYPICLLQNLRREAVMETLDVII